MTVDDLLKSIATLLSKKPEAEPEDVPEPEEWTPTSPAYLRHVRKCTDYAMGKGDL